MYAFIAIIVIITLTWYICRKKQDSVQDVVSAESDMYENMNNVSTLQPAKIEQKYKKIILSRNYGNNDVEFVLQKAKNFRSNVRRRTGIELQDRGLKNAIKDTRKQIVKQKVATIKKMPNKVQQNNTYTALSQTHQVDTQNVHDSAVNSDLQNTYNIIKNDTSKIELFQSNDVIYDYIKYKSDASDDVKRRATKTLEKMANSTETVVTLGQDFESTILNNVWNRSNHEDNRSNSIAIKDAVVSSLADCWENGSMVCTGGRSARIISALATLDINPSSGMVASRQAYRNEAFTLANDTLKQIINDDLQSENIEAHQFAQTFVTTNYDEMDDSGISEHVKKSFAERVMSPIDKYLTKNQEHLSDNIREEIILGLGV